MWPESQDFSIQMQSSIIVTKKHKFSVQVSFILQSALLYLNLKDLKDLALSFWLDRNSLWRSYTIGRPTKCLTFPLGTALLKMIWCAIRECYTRTTQLWSKAKAETTSVMQNLQRLTMLSVARDLIFDQETNSMYIICTGSDLQSGKFGKGHRRNVGEKNQLESFLLKFCPSFLSVMITWYFVMQLLRSGNMATYWQQFPTWQDTWGIRLSNIIWKLKICTHKVSVPIYHSTKKLEMYWSDTLEWDLH